MAKKRSNDRPDWFPCYPAALLVRLAALPPDEGLMYTVALLRIYDAWGPIDDTAEVLGRRAGYQPAKARKVVDSLLRQRLLVRLDDGRLTNEKAMQIIAEQNAEISRQRIQKTGAANSRWVKEKQNQPKPDAAAMRLDADSREVRDSLFQEEKAPPEPAPESDIRTQLFRKGLGILVKITGKPQDKCRPLIGSWLKQRNDDAVAVLRAIEDAERNRVADPIPWIRRALAVRDDTRRQTSNGGAAILARMMKEETANAGNAETLDQQRALPAGRSG